METVDHNKDLAIDYCNWILKRRENPRFKYTVANDATFSYYMDEKKKEQEQKEKEKENI